MHYIARTCSCNLIIACMTTSFDINQLKGRQVSGRAVKSQDTPACSRRPRAQRHVVGLIRNVCLNITVAVFCASTDPVSLLKATEAARLRLHLNCTGALMASGGMQWYCWHDRKARRKTASCSGIDMTGTDLDHVSLIDIPCHNTNTFIRTDQVFGMSQKSGLCLGSLDSCSSLPA
jgi:hypothetical protein